MRRLGEQLVLILPKLSGVDKTGLRHNRPESYFTADSTAIFAFGAVLYEMLTGRKVFEGETRASLIGAIMHAHPAPIAGLRALMPPALDRIVLRCLAKDPENRVQTARDLVLELKWITDRIVSGIGA